MLSPAGQNQDHYLVLLCRDFFVPMETERKCAIGKRWRYEVSERVDDCAKCLNIIGHILHMKRERLFENTGQSNICVLYSFY